MVDSSEKQWIFVGLGNPGKKYEFTRHNLGYLVTEGFAHLHKLTWKEDKKLRARVAKGVVDGITVHLVQPTTYMNESGQAVRKYIDYYKLTSDDLVVITDDIALPYGDIRVRGQGSAGGHNGLKSVEKHLGTNQYLRLRLGIDRRSGPMGPLSDYVLDVFNRSEMSELPTILDKGVRVLEMLMKQPVSDVMTAVNMRSK